MRATCQCRRDLHVGVGGVVIENKLWLFPIMTCRCRRYHTTTVSLIYQSRVKGFLFKDSPFIVEDEVAATSGVSFSTGAKVAWERCANTIFAELWFVVLVDNTGVDVRLGSKVNTRDEDGTPSAKSALLSVWHKDDWLDWLSPNSNRDKSSSSFSRKDDWAVLALWINMD